MESLISIYVYRANFKQIWRRLGEASFYYLITSRTLLLQLNILIYVRIYSSPLFCMRLHSSLSALIIVILSGSKSLSRDKIRRCTISYNFTLSVENFIQRRPIKLHDSHILPMVLYIKLPTAPSMWQK